MGHQRSVTWLTDPRALRAYAHPVRMALVGLLRTEGPLTVARAAELLGESTSACSFHLRQLARYGLVEEAGDGTGRERPWRATAMSTSWEAAPASPELAAATTLLNTVIAERYFEQLASWLDRSQHEPKQWRRAALFGDRFTYLTAAELTEFGAKALQLLDAYSDRVDDPSLRPDGARRISYLHLAFPSDSEL
jgi:hypothetical protein